MVRIGRGLTALPRVAAHAGDGDFSGEQVDAIVRGIAHVERAVPGLPGAAREACINGLLGQAWSGATPSQISERARGDAFALACEAGVVPVAENAALNQVSIGRESDGRVRGRFDVDAVFGEKLLTGLDPLTRPVPAEEDAGSAVGRAEDGRGFGAVDRCVSAGRRSPDGGWGASACDDDCRCARVGR